MTNQERKYSQFLIDITEKTIDFIKNAYLSGGGFNVENSQIQDEDQTGLIENNNIFENVDSDKIEVIDYADLQPQKLTINKTLFYVIGAIIIYNLLKRK